MTVRKKTTLIIALIFTGLLLAVYGGSQVFVLKAFERHEQEHVYEGLNRIDLALSRELRSLASTTAGWAVWDDTYEYIVNPDDEYVKLNIEVDETFIQEQLNLMLYVDASGRIVHGKEYDYRNHKTSEVSRGWRDYLYVGAPILTFRDVKSTVTGIVRLPEGPMLFSSVPIITSEYRGPIRGAVIFGRYLDEAVAEKLTEITLYSVAVHPVDATDLPANVRQALGLLSPQSPNLLQALSSEQIAGYALLTDIEQKPVAVFETSMPREIYAGGQRVTLYFAAVLAIVGLIFGLVTWLLLEKAVLARMAKLGASVGAIGATGNLSARVAVTGKDELSDLATDINKMLDALEQAQRKLHESEEHFQLIARASNDIFWDCNLLTGETTFSQSMRTQYGYDGSGGRTTAWRLERMHPDDRQRIDASLQDVLTTGRGFWCGEYHFQKSDGSYVCVFDRGYVIRDGKGKAVRMVGSMMDITERKRAEEARRARETAEEANKAKSEFLSRMSHELRTPLNAILGFTQLLEMENLSAQQSENLGYIMSAGRHLLDLINEVLDIARIESGRMRVSLEPVPVQDVLDECLDLVRSMAGQQNVDVRPMTPRVQNEHVTADRQRLKQVLLNLLSNAIKYNHHGGNVSLECEHTSRGTMRIAVRDTGRGIPPDKFGRLFTPFDRLGAEQSGIDGTGLGLALSKRLIEAMNGTIGAESTPGQGSTFWLELALAVDPSQEEAQLPAGPLSMAYLPAHPRTILYVEDNLSNLRLVERVLSNWPDIKLQPVMQGRLGLELASEVKPDIILLDMHLPDILGDEVLRRLKEHPDTAGIPVIIITADANPSLKSSLLEAGALAYLTKPLNIARFIEVISEALEERRQMSHAT